MKRKVSAAVVLLFIVSLASMVFSASAADMLITNYSFESGTVNWTQAYGTSGMTASSEQAYTGTQSAKIVDTSTTANLGLESGKLDATAGTTYLAYAKVFVVSGSVDLYLRFWNSSGTVVGNGITTVSAPANQWTTTQVKYTAPANTAKVSVLLYSGIASTSTAYWDDVLITKEFTSLGNQVVHTSTLGTTFGISTSQDKIYTVGSGSAGSDAVMSIIDADTNAVVANYPLPGALGAWGATTATDGKVYFGGYSNGHVYRYSPGATSVSDLGLSYTGGENIYAVTAGTGGKIYGGGFGDAGFFKYEPSVGFSMINTKPIWPNEEYVRSLAYDAASNVTYIGTGTNGNLVRFDNTTGAKTNILPAAYASETFVYELNFTGGKLFAGLRPSGTVLAMSIDASGNATLDATLPALPSPAQNGKVYYVSGGQLYAYDLTAKTSTNLGVAADLGANKYGWVQLADQTNFPGDSLVVYGSKDGRMSLFKYNLQTGNTSIAYVSGMPELTTIINQIGGGSDGKIYSGGYLDGGIGRYTPMRGDANEGYPDENYAAPFQTYSFLALNGYTYYASYGSAKLWKFDPALSWSSTNPTLLFDQKSDGMDRPVEMISGGGKIFMGNVAEYGSLKGGLTIYDPATNTRTLKKDIVTDQSVTALAYYNGKVYGGTSIKGGNGLAPTQTQAKLFVYDVATATKTGEYALPVAGLTGITGMTSVDGKIWGMAEGYLFIFNPTTNTFDYFQEKFADVDYNGEGTWVDATLLTVSKDPNYVYGTIRGTYLFKINRSTKAVTTISSSGAYFLAADGYENLYYVLPGGHTELVRYAY
ncbi:carbohydrate binding domain-containing protein [Paenibacillus qinlingensis]|uniref:carbohydrate binding domain-containing protein n=1 Tax=Paenibacillus qinlingensis TaxID=1837343 RepID=UPI00156501AA|nr:carbohydrate binding domain-containing protein [Paenibacillus qinlingensis]NQX60154.1 carbohydrate binding domain-containing protein [Paenibacillus qinlingensis]